MKKTRVVFNSKKLKEAMLKNVVDEQTERLVTYAREELYEMIVTRDFKSRTFNLADSYVWAVYYNGKKKKSGYVGAKMANKKSLLHEWSKDPSRRIPVEGRKEAREFLKSFENTLSKDGGWVCVWAACAPYAEYLDPAAGNTRTNNFFVISQRYDHIKETFEPKGVVKFEVLSL